MDFVTVTLSDGQKLSLRVQDVSAILEAVGDEQRKIAIIFTRLGHTWYVPDADREIREMVIDAQRGYPEPA